MLPPYGGGAGEGVAAFSEGGSVLVIDPGHGGADGGASAADGTLESGINLAVALRLRALAGLYGVEDAHDARERGDRLPRGADTLAEMKRADQRARLELINSTPGAVLISIHQNYYPDPRPSGSQVFYAPSEGSEALAGIAHGLIADKLCPDNRRVAAPGRGAHLPHARGRVPAILVECGFISNAEELAKLTSGKYQTKLAASLLSAYLQYESAPDGMVV